METFNRYTTDKPDDSTNINKIISGRPVSREEAIKLIESFNEGFEEYIIDWEIRDLGKNGDGKGPICESWEIPVQFYFEDKQWKCRTHHTPGDDESFWNSAIKSRAEQWIPGEGGTRNDYKCQYKTANGWFDQNDPQLKTEVEAA